MCSLTVLFLIFAFLFAGCKQGPSSAMAQPSAASLAAKPPSQPPSPGSGSPSSPPSSAGQQAPQPGQEDVKKNAPDVKLEESEESLGPFTVARQTFTAIRRLKHFPGKTDEFAQTDAILEIRDAGGIVQYRQEIPYAIEKGEERFQESCRASVEPLSGAAGSGFLLNTDCEPSAPGYTGPWQVIGFRDGKLLPAGKPFYVSGTVDKFVPGEIRRAGDFLQMRPDVLRMRVFTGYFDVIVPLRIVWNTGHLALAQQCFHSTPTGPEEEACEMPVEGIKRQRHVKDMTFVRLFAESNEGMGPPAHAVINSDSDVEILAAKVSVSWTDGENGGDAGLGLGDDIWIKIRIDGKEGWIHTEEDLQAIGLYRAG